MLLFQGGSVARHAQLPETETLIMGRAGKFLFLGYLEFIMILSGLMGVNAHAFKKHALVLILSIYLWHLCSVSLSDMPEHELHAMA